ncbi:hypothetical protein ACFS27_23020 [Promicromonospora vindobonensis]|uniref:Uncharacterized protein n=1 Tax=Promicromonospora vindobonensis TaxID=195748 RepID=A0ABW5VXS6_9MICO
MLDEVALVAEVRDGPRRQIVRLGEVGAGQDLQAVGAGMCSRATSRSSIVSTWSLPGFGLVQGVLAEPHDQDLELTAEVTFCTQPRHLDRLGSDLTRGVGVVMVATEVSSESVWSRV